MIYFANPFAQYQAHQKEIDDAIRAVLNSGNYILGEQVNLFEKEFSNYLGMNHAIGVANGTDALVLALRGLEIGANDEVIIPSMTATATAAAVNITGATPVFVDIEKEYYTLDPNCVEKSITQKTKAIIAVHLYGQPADMNALRNIAKKNNLKLIEDCAQAVGAHYYEKSVGNFSDVACFSFFPTKNLGAIGDGGAVATQDDVLAEHIRMLRQYGWDKNRDSQFFGINSRLDELQASILRVKLKYLDEDTQKRNQIAQYYFNALQNSPFILPAVRKNILHAYHLYVVQCENRDAVIKQLRVKNIFAGVHYPKAVHQMPAYCNHKNDLSVTESAAARVISLPMYPELTHDQQTHIISTLRDNHTVSAVN